ncbi:hypothetical protein ACE1SV_60470 [Streptomyces sp. E-15]
MEGAGDQPALVPQVGQFLFQRTTGLRADRLRVTGHGVCSFAADGQPDGAESPALRIISGSIALMSGSIACVVRAGCAVGCPGVPEGERRDSVLMS